MKRTALVCVVVGSLLAACASVPEIPGSASTGGSLSGASPAASAAAGASAAASPDVVASASAAAPSPASSAAPSLAAAPSADAIGKPDPNAPLTGTVWQWLQIESTVDAATMVSKPNLYTIEFRDDSTIGIRSDCNSAGGTYKTDGSTFNIFVGPQTTAACPDGSLSADFLRELPSVQSFVLDNGTLKLAPTSDGGIMSFVPAP